MFLRVHERSKKTSKQKKKQKEKLSLQRSMDEASYSNTKRFFTGKRLPETPVALPQTDRLALNSHRLTTSIPSKPDTVTVAVKKESNTYTGDKLIGIGTLHKSNLIPVFKGEEAKEIARMRR